MVGHGPEIAGTRCGWRCRLAIMRRPFVKHGMNGSPALRIPSSKCNLSTCTLWLVMGWISGAEKANDRGTFRSIPCGLRATNKAIVFGGYPLRQLSSTVSQDAPPQASYMQRPAEPYAHGLQWHASDPAKAEQRRECLRNFQETADRRACAKRRSCQ